MEKQIENRLNYISLSEASRMTGYTPEHLNLMVRKKILRAEKLGRNWYTTKLWLDYFLVSNPTSRKKEIIEEKKQNEILPGKAIVITPEKIVKPSLEISQKINRENDIRENTQKEAEAEIIFKQTKERLWRKNVLRFSYSAIAGMIILFIGIPAVKYFGQEKKYSDEILTQLENYSVQGPEGIVRGEEIVNENIGSENDAALESENFRIKQISIGGDMAVAAGADENASPEIQDVHGETYLTKKQDEAKLIVTWKTNKLALSEIEYSKNNGQNPKKMKEGNYGFNHAVLISGLELGTAYVYKIKIRDRWGNEVSTGYYAVYGGSKAVSVFELISQEFEKMFGWVVESH